MRMVGPGGLEPPVRPTDISMSTSWKATFSTTSESVGAPQPQKLTGCRVLRRRFAEIDPLPPIGVTIKQHV